MQASSAHLSLCTQQVLLTYIPNLYDIVMTPYSGLLQISPLTHFKLRPCRSIFFNYLGATLGKILSPQFTKKYTNSTTTI